MATYKEIQGTAVQSLTDSTSTIEGQIWYSTPTTNFKLTSVTSAAAWSTGGAYPAVFQGGAGFGTQTAAVGAGGTPSPVFNLKTFEYDGSTWTAGNDMTRASGSPYTSGYNAGSGTLTAGWVAGGGYPTINAFTENYNGTSWTASAAMPAARRGGNCTGPQTAGLYFAGVFPAGPPAPVQNTTFAYDGEAWTATGYNLTNARTNAGSSGPTGAQTAALSFGGNTPGFTNATEEYNGSNWATGGNYPTGTAYVGYFGPSTNCYGFTGYAGGSALTSTNFYNGTSWASSPASLSTGRLNYHNNAGTASSGLVFGGEGPTTQTEEFNAAGSLETVTITTT